MNYYLHYQNLITRAKGRELAGYKEKHHVKPKCLGGGEELENIVFLSAREHFIAHQLLVKLHPGHYGLVYAATLMTKIGRGNGRVNNRLYSWLREKFAKAVAKNMQEYMRKNNPSKRASVRLLRKAAWSGENNPSYRNPNRKSIEAAAAYNRGKTHTEEVKKKRSESLKRVHRETPGKCGMLGKKNPKAVAAMMFYYERNRTYYWGA